MGGTEDDKKAMLEKVRRGLPHLEVKGIASTPVPGVYVMDTASGHESRMIHVLDGGSHVIVGDMYALREDGAFNVTETHREAQRRILLRDMASEDSIASSPNGARRSTLFVFVDVDCRFCRELHQEVEQLNLHGIEVRYLAYPRGGPESATWKKMTSAWCSKDRKNAISRLMRGELAERAAATSCEATIAAQYELAITMNAKGTPLIVSDSGKAVHGFFPAMELLDRLGLAEDSVSKSAGAN